jgi:hypothetical protein
MKIKIKEFTASEITSTAMQILCVNGFEVWRNNNLAVKGRKFIGKRGAADITGYEKRTGKRLECEVKTIKDVLSKEQHDFLSDVAMNGGYSILATQKGDKIVLQYYYEVAGEDGCNRFNGAANKKIIQ